MDKKQLILGVAIGIFISSSIFLVSFEIYENSNNDDLIVQTEEPTDEYVIDRATEMGMIFFDRLLFQDDDGTVNDDGDMVLSSDDYIYVTIPKGCSTEDVANILEREGLIDDKDDFADFVINKNMSRKLRYGQFLIPKDVTYDQLLEILSA